MAKINENERSWAIDLMIDGNIWLAQRNIAIKRIGGENTLASGAGSLFPDVLLFGDVEKGHILQNWELKFPDTSLEDEVFIKNAKGKAKSLSLNSFLLWNVSTAILYKIEEDDDLKIVKIWNNLSYVKTRQEINQYKKEINEMLIEILNDLNDFISSGVIKTTSVVTALSSDAISQLMQNNLGSYIEALKDGTRNNTIFSHETTLWWRYAKNDYPEEQDKFVVLGRNNLLSLINKFLFAHILKPYQMDANLVDTIDSSTNIDTAIETFIHISEKCDFWNIFRKQPGEELVTYDVWRDILSFNNLLKEFNFTKIEKTLLHDLIELIVYRNKRKFAGQFTTPIELARFAVRLTIRDRNLPAIDPCCGTGTIAKEIYNFKRESLSVNQSLGTLWASDKFSFPLQMAMFNLANPETLGLVFRVFKADLTKLSVGEEIKLHEPFSGSIIIEKLPEFDYIISNLPFVQQEDLEFLNDSATEINRFIEEKIGIGFALSGRSDLYSYLPFYLWNLLNRNGRMTIIVSNSWLGTAWGKKFYGALSAFFEIENIIISGKGRWFSNAKVITSAITLKKKEDPTMPQTTEKIKFTVTKRRLIDYNSENLEEIIAMTSSQDNAEEEDISIHTYSYQEINEIQSLGINLNSFFANNKWILELGEKLIKVSSLFDIGRGERRGWDAMFYPNTTNEIEAEYLRPVLKSPRSIHTLVTGSDGVAFCCDKSKEDLRKLGHTKALAWINKFEGYTNENGTPLISSLARRGMYWYTMLPETTAEMVTNINFGDRLFIARFQEPTFVNQRLVRFSRKYKNVDDKLCHALMNSLVGLFYIEAMGTGRGEGALDLSKDKIEADLRIINPKLISNGNREKIIKLFEKLETRVILPILQELEHEDRINFDDAVLEAIGCLQYKKQIKDSLLTLYGIRASVND